MMPAVPGKRLGVAWIRAVEMERCGWIWHLPCLFLVPHIFWSHPRVGSTGAGATLPLFSSICWVPSARPVSKTLVQAAQSLVGQETHNTIPECGGAVTLEAWKFVEREVTQSRGRRRVRGGLEEGTTKQLNWLTKNKLTKWSGGWGTGMPGLARPSGNPEDAKYAWKGGSIKTRAGAGERGGCRGRQEPDHELTFGSWGENRSGWEACTLQLPI